MDRLKGKTALITGGGAGLGRAMALRFVEEGANVVIGDVSEDGLRETTDLIGRLGAEDAVLARRLDVTREADCQSAVQAVVERWGRLDISLRQRRDRRGARQGQPDRFVGTGRLGARPRRQPHRRLPQREARLPGDAAARRRDPDHGLGRRAARHADLGRI